MQRKPRLARLPLLLWPVIVMLSLGSDMTVVPAAKAQTARDGMMSTSQALGMLYARNLALKILLSNYRKDPTTQLQGLRDIEEALERYSRQKRSVLQVNSVDELRVLEAGLVPPVWDLADEASLLKSWTPPYIVVATQSDDVMQALEAELENSAHFSANQAAFAGAAGFESYFRQLMTNPQASKGLLSLLSDAQRLDGLSQFDQAVDQAIGSIETIGEQITRSGAIHLKDLVWQHFFELMLGQYFKNLDPATKLDMVAVLASQGAPTDPIGRFALLVRNSGPQFQKFFQVYARQAGFSAELQDVFKQLEQDAKPVPWRLVKPIIDSQSVAFTWVDIDHEPLGVGTMAQVHKAVIRLRTGERKTVVVRILKPSISECVKIDNFALARVAKVIDTDPELRRANYPLISPFIEQIEEMSEKEAILSNTIQAQFKAAPIYEKTMRLVSDSFKGVLHFRVPEIYDLGEQPKLMVQEYVEGTSFEKFSRHEPELAKLAVINLANLWIEKTLIGDGFYHADLHQGNLRVQRRGDQITVNLLDFGMTGQLDETMQNKFILFGAAVSLRDPDLMSKILWELSTAESNLITRDQLRSVFRAELERERRAGIRDWPFNEWVALSVNSGIRFPTEFTSLNRGTVLISRMLEEYGMSFDLAKTIKGLLLASPLRLKRLVGGTNLLQKSDWLRLITQGIFGHRDDSKTPKTASGLETTRNPSRATDPQAILCQDVFAPTL